MRKKRTLLIYAIVAEVAFITLLAYNPHSGEPSYDGHPLSYWVATLAPPQGPSMVDPSELDKARNAIDHIGVAALPFLVKWIHYERPTWRFVVGYFLSRVPLAGADRLSQRIIETQRYQLAEGTPYAFKLLGKEATPAFDDLCRLMNDTNGTEGSVRAPGALVCFGTNALPQLLAVATNELHPNRPNALEAIGEMSDIGDAAQIAITALTNCLNPTNDPFLQMTAISALGNLKTSPQSSVPALVSCLKSTTPQLRWYSTMALGKFGPQAISAIPALTKAIADPDPDVRKSAASALHQIDPATFTNSPSQ